MLEQFPIKTKALPGLDTASIYFFCGHLPPHFYFSFPFFPPQDLKWNSPNIDSSTFYLERDFLK